MRRSNRSRQRATLTGLVFITLMVCLLLGGCTSIITYIRSDNSTGTDYCEPDGGAVISVRRDCIINQPNQSPGGVTTSTQRQQPPTTKLHKQEGPQ